MEDIQKNIKRFINDNSTIDALEKELLSVLSIADEIEEDRNDYEVVFIPIENIKRNPNQPRKIFDEDKLLELSHSIKENGLLSPIHVISSNQDNLFYLVAGERRLRASKMAGLTKIPAIIREFSKNQLLEIALLENIQREDLNVIEIAQALNDLEAQFNYSHEEIAKKIGKSREYVTNTLRLLQLSKKMQNMLASGELTAGHARAVLALKDEAAREELANKIAKEKMTVREAEAIAFHKKDYEEYAKILNDYLGIEKVSVNRKYIKIPFDSAEELKRFMDILTKKDFM